MWSWKPLGWSWKVSSPLLIFLIIVGSEHFGKTWYLPNARSRWLDIGLVIIIFFFLHLSWFSWTETKLFEKDWKCEISFFNKPVVQIPRVDGTCVIFFLCLLVDEFYSRNFLVYEFFVFVFAPPPPLLKLNGLSLKKKGPISSHFDRTSLSTIHIAKTNVFLCD